MNLHLYIVGTGHHNQFGPGAKPFGGHSCDEKGGQAFHEYLHGLCKSYGIKAIAEELNHQSLTEVGVLTSIPKTLSYILKIPHLFCEPDRNERRDLGILDDNEIRALAFANNIDESALPALFSEHSQLREKEWCRRLKQFNISPILFICGSGHVDSFSIIAKDLDISTQIIIRNWNA